MDEISRDRRPSDEQLVYRPAVPDDSRAIADLICQAGGGLYEFLFDDLIPLVSAVDIVAAGVGMRGGPLSYANCLVASSASAGVVGVANFFPTDSLAEDTFLSLMSDRFDHISPMLRLRDPGSMFLNAIAVSGNYRGNGVGTRLIALTEVASLEAGLSRLSLHVWVDNVVAIKLYKRHGFSEVGIAALAASPRLPHSGGSLLMRKMLQGPAAKKNPA
jgi:ribosomal protein S18 acetylase RimI-like enzyme